MLCTYRRAMSLCYKSNEKWSKDHICAHAIQLHVVQELRELFQLQDDELDFYDYDAGTSKQLLLVISKAAVNGSKASRTMRFLGTIQHKVATLLVILPFFFLSCRLAKQLYGIVSLDQKLSVQISGGGTLSCDVVIPQALCFIEDTPFQSESPS